MATTPPPTAGMPSIHLYTSKEQGTESAYYRNFLVKGDYPFEETRVAATTSDEMYRLLVHQFGDGLDLPGIVLQDTVWIHASDTSALQQAWGQAWFDNFLCEPQDKLLMPPGEEDESPSSRDINYVPLSADHRKNSSGQPRTTQRPPAVDDTRRHHSESLLSAASQTTTTTTALANLILPNGTEVAIGALIRLLMRATSHEYVEREGNRFFYFRGFEGMELWSILFFDDHQPQDVQDFGRLLVERGIVHNYTPKCADFSKSFLVLQPLQEPRVLNSFVKWPTNEKSQTAQDPMDVLLRLSRLMDEICQSDYRENLHLYHEFEIGCCQLQVLGFPVDQRERVTFVLNLFNLAVRHAVICCEERKWNWPSSLEGLAALFNKIGYKINGIWVSLAELQASLYGNTECVLPPVESSTGRFFWQRWSCCGEAAVAGQAEYAYVSRVIRTDPRLVFAMTFGTKSSPTVSTLYPNRLEEGLQAATEDYVRANIVMTDKGVQLPALVGWFRHDFGVFPEAVLHFLLPYMKVQQMQALEGLWDRNILEVSFDRYHDWKSGLAVVPPHILSAAEASAPESPVVESEMVPVAPKAPILPPMPHADKDNKSPFFDLIDPTPLQFAMETSMPDAASKATATRKSLASSKRLARQVSMKSALLPPAGSSLHSQKPLLRRLWGRNPSVGDFAPRRPGLAVDRTETMVDHDDDDDYHDAMSDDGHSFFQSVVSEVTFGSEFQDLLRRRSKRSLHVGYM